MAGGTSAAITGGGGFRSSRGRRLRQSNEEGKRGGNGGGAHRGCDGGLGELGEASEAANRQRRSSVAEEGKSVGTALRGFSGRVSRRGGRGRHCGAQEHVGEERGWRWPRGSLSVAAAPFGPGEREGTEERWGRGSEREGSRGRGGAEEKARGVVVASVTQAGREVRGAAGARALSPSSAFWQR